MSKVLMEMSMSLDGYVTGPDVSTEEPMGRGGEQLHDWIFGGRSPAEIERFQSDLCLRDERDRRRAPSSS